MDEFVKDLLRKNFTIPTIIRRCEKNNWHVTIEHIEYLRHEVNLEIELERKEKKNKTETKVIQLFDSENKYFDFAKKAGVNLEYKDNIELISIIQKVTAEVFIKQSICLLRALELLSEGENVDVNVFWKGYEVSLNALCKAWGINNLIDVNAAFQCLESKGYLTNDNYLSQIPKIYSSN
jgi:hypothetical protein